MAEQESAGGSSQERHPGRAAADGGAAETRGAEGHEPPRSGPRPGDRSGIQWWETCGGWSVRYAMGTF